MMHSSAEDAVDGIAGLALKLVLHSP